MTRRGTLICGVVVGALATTFIGGIAWAAIPNADGNIYACYSNGDGSVRVQNDPAKPCSKNWSPLKWSAGGSSTTTYTKSDVVHADANSQGAARVNCDDGDVATGGGFSTGSNEGRVLASYPVLDPETLVPVTWAVFVLNESASVALGGVAYAVCQHTE